MAAVVGESPTASSSWPLRDRLGNVPGACPVRSSTRTSRRRGLRGDEAEGVIQSLARSAASLAHDALSKKFGRLDILSIFDENQRLKRRISARRTTQALEEGALAATHIGRRSRTLPEGIHAPAVKRFARVGLKILRVAPLESHPFPRRLLVDRVLRFGRPPFPPKVRPDKGPLRTISPSMRKRGPRDIRSLAGSF